MLLFRRNRNTLGLLNRFLSSSSPFIQCNSISFDKIKDDISVIPSFINEREEEALMQEIEPKLRKKKYEKAHFDSVIQNFRETEISIFKHEIPANVINRTRAWITEQLQEEDRHARDTHFLPTHVLDLALEGSIQPHVDSTKFSGGIIAGISLLSPCTMRLRPVDEHDDENADGGVVPSSWRPPADESSGQYIDLILPPRSLYLYKKDIRYKMTHEILPAGTESDESGKRTSRRVSLLFRDVPDDFFKDMDVNPPIMSGKL
eukprot:g786.t1